MKVRLRSNFRDYYDQAFSNVEGPYFSRFDNVGPTRPEMLVKLARHGYLVPRFGKVSDFACPLNTPPSQVVVHDDITAHCGTGKRLVSFDQVLGSPDAFAVEYIRPFEGRAVSHRWLGVGRRRFLLRYESAESDWLSNLESRVELVSEHHDVPGKYVPTTPLWAIDFVRCAQTNAYYALDLNLSPGLSPLAGVLPPAEVVEEIALHLDTQPCVRTACKCGKC